MLLEAVAGARRVVEIGVYEGASALALLRALGAGRGAAPDRPLRPAPRRAALRAGARASGPRGACCRARCARRGAEAPRVHWHVAPLRTRWPRAGRGRSTWCSSTATTPRPDASSTGRAGIASSRRGGHVVFHDARADRPGGRGLPGPTAVVDRHFRTGGGSAGLGDRRRGRPHRGGAAAVLRRVRGVHPADGRWRAKNASRKAPMADHHPLFGLSGATSSEYQSLGRKPHCAN